MTILSFFTNTLKFCLGAVGLAVGALYYFQDNLLYYPAMGDLPLRTSENPRGYRSPAEHGIEFEDVMIGTTTPNVKIHAWLLLRSDHSRSRPPTLIFFHGNAGNIGFRLPNARYMVESLGCNVLMVEYRGYGNSDQAVVNEEGLKDDSISALKWVQEHPNLRENPIFLFGRSLGGGCAFYLADYAQKNGIKIDGVIVENTFLSISKMVDSVMPLVAPFKNLVLRIGWNNEELAPALTNIPILYLSGAIDELVPPAHMDRLHQITGGKMYKVANGTHNDTWVKGGRQYWRVFSEWMRGVLDGESSGIARGTPVKAQEVEIGLGGDSKSPRSDSTQASIPIMPKGLYGMAKAAGSSSSKANTGSDKKDKGI